MRNGFAIALAWPKTLCKRAGAWFLTEEYNSENSYKVIRFSPDGTIECDGQFTTNQPFEISKEYSITYPSHCAKVTLSQFGKIITLHKK